MLPSPVISQVVYYYFVYFFAGWEHDKSDLIGQFRGLQQIRESDWSVYGMYDYCGDVIFRIQPFCCCHVVGVLTTDCTTMYSTQSAKSTFTVTRWSNAGGYLLIVKWAVICIIIRKHGHRKTNMYGKLRRMCRARLPPCATATPTY